MNRFPRWKYALLVVVLVVCTVYALPNLYPDAPAIQISGSNASTDVTPNTLQEAVDALDKAGISHSKGEKVGNSWLIRVDNEEDQLHGKELAQTAVGKKFLVALNLAPTTPQWLRDIGAKPMNLGLDLRGGVHFLLQVDVKSAIKQRVEAWAGEIKLLLKNKDIRYSDVSAQDQTLQVMFPSLDLRDQARPLLVTQYREFTVRDMDNKPGITMTLTPQALKQIQDYAVDQNRTALANRVNQLGVAEPIVQRQGADRIVVELPGVQDAAQARRVLGRTATLQFRLVADQYDQSRAETGIAPPGTQIFPYKDDQRPPVILKRDNIVTGDQVTDARMGYDQNGRPEVDITLDSSGARRMQRTTQRNIHKPMAVLFIETKSRKVPTVDANGKKVMKRESYKDSYVINVATIQSAFSSRFRITGLDSPAEASELALLLRAGSLAAPVYVVEERTVGPSLGKDNIIAGMKSMVLGLALVLIFMAFWYKLFGMIANVALLANLVIIVAVMSLVPGATLTLPGMAGIVLTVGMAVDANVLIFERIREELRKGMAPLQAIETGYGRAFITILDANLTTLIVAVILFAVATGSVQGFAVTLFIGIVTSMFTAITGTRAIVALIYEGRSPKKLSI